MGGELIADLTIGNDSIRDLYESKAFLERAEYVDSMSGKIKKGYDNIDSNTLNSPTD